MRSIYSVLLCGILLLLPVAGSSQCPISPGTTVPAHEWDAIFTQDGPGSGLEPSGAPGWTGGDSTYSLLLPSGDTAFFFSDSYIGESPRVKGDGTVTRSAHGLRTTAINCLPPMCEPAASIFGARNSIVILSRDRRKMTTLVGKKNDRGLSGSYFAEPVTGLNYWLGDVIALPLNRPDRVLVFLHKFDDKLAFHGAAIAELDPRTLAIRKTVEVVRLPNLDIHWGTAMFVQNGDLYIYGKGQRDGKKQIFVARTKATASVEQLVDSTTWSAWNGTAWTKDLTKVAPIIPVGDSVSDEFNVVRVSVNGRPTFMFAGIDTLAPWGSWRDITLYSA